MTSYRAHFRPSHFLTKPHAMLATAVVCADTDAEAERLAQTVDLNFVRRNKGEFLPLASPDEAAAYNYSPIDRERIRINRERLFVGSPATVRERLAPLIEATAADELMLTSMIYDHAARKRSYALMAEVFGLSAEADVRAAERVA
jgi:alkanesulfonate monooxygenase SsuD/methylene tetrahydromethanopterin reductase-like flavin-dependent oxidoreductase (luciferase family)